jgi:Ca2+-binding EF-hand superfamily protein
VLKNQSPAKRDKSLPGHHYRPIINSKDVQDYNQSSASPSDVGKMSYSEISTIHKPLNEVTHELRKSMEQFHKQIPFPKFLKQIIDRLKVIESDKVLLFSENPSFNLIDAFRALDIDGKGSITLLELNSGLLDM